LLGGAGAGFSSVMSAAVSPGSRLCPAGWAGVVVLGDEVLATAPDQGSARMLEEALGGVPIGSLGDDDVLRSRLPGAELLGPAGLAYLEPAEFRARGGEAVVRAMDRADLGFGRFVLAADTADVEESGIGEIASPAFAVWERGEVVAAAGHRDWPLGTAHLSVLTAAGARGRGLGRAAASAAVEHAIAAGRLAQWQARSRASRRVALSLGFRELGSQVSIDLNPRSRQA